MGRDEREWEGERERGDMEGEIGREREKGVSEKKQ